MPIDMRKGREEWSRQRAMAVKEANLRMACVYYTLTEIEQEKMGEEKKGMRGV